MVQTLNNRPTLITITAFCLLLVAGWRNQLEAADLLLSWADNSNNESGFAMERKTGTNGTFAQIATVGANITSYTDTGLSAGTTFCYQVRAYNSAGNSAFTPAACKTTPTTASTFNFSLAHGGDISVTRGQSVSNVITTTLISGSSQAVSFSTSGSPDGSTASYATSSSCNPTCSRTLNIATSSSTPTGTYPITVTAGGGGVTKTTSFSLTINSTTSVQNYTLSVSVVKSLAEGGLSDGTVTSSPAGINCGSDCTELYASGTVVKLIATPGAGSSFAGWSGNSDCNDGAVTLTANIACTATFNPQALGLTLSKSGSGTGTVVSTPSGITCGSDCSEPFASGTSVKLTATAAAGSVFRSWSIANCGTTTVCNVVVNGSTPVTAVFDPISEAAVADKIGFFRPSTEEWFLDMNGNRGWDGCNIDKCFSSWGIQTDLPVAGDWDGSGKARIGVFRFSTREWFLDMNGNGAWDGCNVDKCFSSFGQQDDLPVAGDWDGSGKARIGVFRPSTRQWFLDINGNGGLDGCNVDKCFSSFGQQTDLPVAGDWDGSGKARIGVFRPSTGQWFLDINGNGGLDGCNVDKCYSPFGQQNDLPVVGDWDGSGKAKIGVFRPSTAEWFLDMNGNGGWDGCNVDACISSFGQIGDLPVVGNW